MPRIASWNVWNDADSLPVRIPSILKNLRTLDADIVALQEATPDFTERCRAELSYPYVSFHPYPEEEEGLAFLSRYAPQEIHGLYGACQAVHAAFDVNGQSLSVTNVHLPWNSVLQREKQILYLEEYLSAADENKAYCFLSGDFNAGTESSVHRFLTGQQSLSGAEASPLWLDLKAEYSGLSGIDFPPSLDCLHNSRWEGKNRLYAPEDFDRIYLRDRWHPFSLYKVGMIGTQKDAQTELHPSDHYGVYVDFQMM